MPILPPGPPPFFPLGAVECRLAQLAVDLVVSLAQPIAELVAASGLDGLLRYVPLEVFGAYPAGVQLCEQMHKTPDIGLLRCRRRRRVRRGDRVQQRPGGPAERLDVGGTVARRD